MGRESRMGLREEGLWPLASSPERARWAAQLFEPCLPETRTNNQPAGYVLVVPLEGNHGS